MSRARTVLLTGATGFLGSNLLKGLHSAGYEVIILKRSTSNTWRIIDLLSKVKCYNIDRVPLTQAFKDQRINFVIHTACNYGRNDNSACQVVETNLMFSLELIEAAVHFNTDTFFNADTFFNTDAFFNSGLVQQKYLSNYTLSKKQFVEWLRLYSNKSRIVNFKLQHLYGPLDNNSKFIPWVLTQFKKGVDKIDFTTGTQLRDFIYIDDVVSAYLVVLEKCAHLPEFNEFDVGTGVLTNIRSCVEMLKAAYERQHNLTQVKLNFGALPYSDGEIMSVNVNLSALRALGWQAKIELNSGLMAVVNRI